MDNELKQMGKRLGELRTIMDVSVAEMARITGTTEAEYIAHEAGEIDSSFTFIYRCAERLGVDMSALVTGES
ncbi:MAG: helix-turn-helix transcriptional regulator, partial [Lentisphaeria bacterium]|nr:helix-turn-helix transcriptional regulator [Lentisphaeria bacterium]